MSEWNYYEKNEYGTRYKVKKFVFKCDMTDYILDYYWFDSLNDEEYDELMNLYTPKPSTHTEEYVGSIRHYEIYRNSDGDWLVKIKVNF